MTPDVEPHIEAEKNEAKSPDENAEVKTEATEEEALKKTELSLHKDFGADVDLLMTIVPDKMGFKIGEVSEMLGLKNHILRYWETEFPVLKPQKAQNNQRMYTKKEIEKLLLVRKLLYVDKFSISGAKRALREWQSDRTKNKVKSVDKNSYLELGKELGHLLDTIKDLKTYLQS